jgi:uncharacterized hydantoinase/oxoprolinase family protein
VLIRSAKQVITLHGGQEIHFSSVTQCSVGLTTTDLAPLCSGVLLPHQCVQQAANVQWLGRILNTYTGSLRTKIWQCRATMHHQQQQQCAVTAVAAVTANATMLIQQTDCCLWTCHLTSHLLAHDRLCRHLSAERNQLAFSSCLITTGAATFPSNNPCDTRTSSSPA